METATAPIQMGFTTESIQLRSLLGFRTAKTRSGPQYRRSVCDGQNGFDLLARCDSQFDDGKTRNSRSGPKGV
jgi:hypothetical protein